MDGTSKSHLMVGRTGRCWNLLKVMIKDLCAIVNMVLEEIPIMDMAN